MIDLLFHFGSDIVLVRIDGEKIEFGNSASGAYLAPLQNLKLSRHGVIREFPDLMEREDWNTEAVKRFKDKIKDLKTEKARAEYIIKDLRKFGYIPKYMQKKGFRPEVIR